MKLLKAVKKLQDRKCRYIKRRGAKKALAALRDEHSSAHRLYTGYILDDIFLTSKDGELSFDDYLATDWECIL